MDKSFSKLPLWKRNLFRTITFLLPVVLFFVISEFLLRALPIPGIRYNIAKYDSLTGGGFYPHSVNIYRNDRGDFVKRKLNRWGYYDVDHSQEKPADVMRIGFFGDSFVESVQVPLDTTFPYLVNEDFTEKKIETLCFGVGGFSTFQSYLNSARWTDFFDIDLVIYVFVENDLGDQIKPIKRSNAIPYPVVKNGRLVADNSFRKHGEHRAKWYYDFFDYLTSKSLVLSTLSERIKLISKYGVNINMEEEDRYLGGNDKKLNDGQFPKQGDSPAIWPDTLRNYATQLGEKVISEWHDNLSQQDRKFAVLYIPKARELGKSTENQNTWKPWLVDLCEREQIPFIDPSKELLSARETGKEVYYDHFTVEGHKAVSKAMLHWLNDYLSATSQ